MASLNKFKSTNVLNKSHNMSHGLTLFATIGLGSMFSHFETINYGGGFGTTTTSYFVCNKESIVLVSEEFHVEGS